jgi:hypothetical protein
MLPIDELKVLSSREHLVLSFEYQEYGGVWLACLAMYTTTNQ